MREVITGDLSLEMRSLPDLEDGQSSAAEADEGFLAFRELFTAILESVKKSYIDWLQTQLAPDRADGDREFVQLQVEAERHSELRRAGRSLPAPYRVRRVLDKATGCPLRATLLLIDKIPAQRRLQVRTPLPGFFHRHIFTAFGGFDPFLLSGRVRGYFSAIIPAGCDPARTLILVWKRHTPPAPYMASGQCRRGAEQIGPTIFA